MGEYKVFSQLSEGSWQSSVESFQLSARSCRVQSISGVCYPLNVNKNKEINVKISVTIIVQEFWIFFSFFLWDRSTYYPWLILLILYWHALHLSEEIPASNQTCLVNFLLFLSCVQVHHSSDLFIHFKTSRKP